MKYKGTTINFTNDIINQKTVDEFLKKNIQNDYLMENIFLQVTMEFDYHDTEEVIEFFYRLFFETIFLRRNLNLSYITQKEMVLSVSLSEAINFISQVTPAIFKERTLKTMKSVDDIRSMIDFYLADTKASDYRFKIDVFKKCLQMVEFETVWKYDNKRLDIIYDLYYNDEMKDRNFMIGIVDYCEYPITTLKTIWDKKTTYIDNTNIQLTLKIDNITNSKIGILDLIRFMHNTNKIVNIKHEDDTLYLTLYDTHIYSDWCSYFDRWYNKYR